MNMAPSSPDPKTAPRETAAPLPSGAGISLSIEGFSAFHYAMAAGCRPVRLLTVDYQGSVPLEHVRARLLSGPALFAPWELDLPRLEPGKHSVSVDAEADPAFLAGLTQDTPVTVQAELYLDGRLLAMQFLEITALAFDRFPGALCPVEYLASFVLPDHPSMDALTEAAGPFDGYETRDPARVLEQAAAIYKAMEGISLLDQPPLDQPQTAALGGGPAARQQGTSLELSLLFAAALEKAGLHPLLLLRQDEAFAGLWLEPRCFPETVQTDPSQITKRLSPGVDELAVFAFGDRLSFQDSMDRGKNLVTGELQYIIDIARARLAGLLPMPLSADGKGLDPERAAYAGGLTMESRSEADPVGEKAVPKMVQWERKLLDLGLRNSLINTRLTRSVIPLLCDAPGELEDALSQGEEYAVSSRPQELRPENGEALTFEDLPRLGQYRDLIRAESKNHRLRSALTEAELSRALQNLYRAARTAMEENGANTLYLALGFLRWYETPASRKSRYAPVVLLPVELVRKSAARGYVLRLRDEDPQMNITLLEMLKQDFGIRVSGLDPLPQDDKGLDLQKVFTVLRRAVMAESRWDVLEAACLGQFSFSQFVMWNDLRNRSEDLQKNKIVRSLMDGRLSFTPEPMEPEDMVPEDGVYLPLPADASQLYAIEAASSGRSFVLHGPPGTGKSQTITALIANALAQGKTVLFVAEKMAALSVVYNRLSKLGFAPFCLELHSNKAKKRTLLDQLQAATEITRKTAPAQYEQKAEEARRLRRELTLYAKALHRTQRCGLSLYELVGRYESVKDAPEGIYFSPDAVKSLTPEALSERLSLTRRLTAAGRAVGHPHDHPLAPVGQDQYTQALRSEALALSRALEPELPGFLEEARSLAALLARPRSTYAELEALRDLARCLTDWAGLPEDWAKTRALSGITGAVALLAEKGARAAALKKELLDRWKPEFLEADGLSLARELEAAQGKWFLARTLEKNSLARRLAPMSRGPVDKEGLSGQLQKLTAYQSLLLEMTASEKLAAPGLKDAYRGVDSDWDSLRAMGRRAEALAARMEEITGGAEFRLRFAGQAPAEAACGRYLTVWDRFMENDYEPLRQLLQLSFPGDFAQGLGGLCAALRENAGQLREWTAWQAACRDAGAAGLSPVVEAYRAGTDHDSLLPMTEKALYQSLASAAIDESQVLSTFSGAVFNETVEQFRQVDEELQRLSAQEIYCLLAARVPDFTREAAQSSELGLLKRAIRSGGRGVSIRRLFEQIPNLLPRLCPCMLMSPISAAQYLDPKREPFDLVVFDEASQMPTCKAVGALARGREAVIVGDPKQMPPTSFFSVNTVDEENLEAEDLESILDDCLALNLPESHLLWHYRSRHESLIAFSNRKFYGSKLCTFPSVSDRDTRVRLIPVSGFFDRGRTRQNRAEAEAIVEELRRRSRDEALKGRSVGVVTFNINQQNLIEDLLCEAQAQDPELESWCNQGEEPLFIKNLENVQGDERDVILFSVAYGPDQEGKLYMNFGPLNRDGGWRRLNVAVSRARQEMTVFSTLAPEDIDLSRTSAEGVAALRDFLLYAKTGQLPPAAADLQEPECGAVARELSRALEQAGYETETMVGHSAYRVDLGVVDPRDPSRYLLGVILDGKTYGEAKTARDRELGQISVLRGLGWNIHRVWTMDWWDNSEKELGVILDLLKRAQAGALRAPGAPAAPGSPAVKEEPEPAPPQPEAPEKELYLPVALEKRDLTAEEYTEPRNRRSLESRFRRTVSQEGPITETLLVRRVQQSCGITRSGTRIQAWNREILDHLGLPVTQEGESRVYWPPEADPAAYKGCRVPGEPREIREIPRCELLNAMDRILSEQIALPMEDLCRESARYLGFSRITGPVSEVMSEAGQFGLDQGRFRLDRGGNVIPG